MDVGLGVGLQDYLRSALCTPYDLHGSQLSRQNRHAVQAPASRPDQTRDG